MSSTEVANAAPRVRREVTQVIDAVPILDTARFEHMQRIANIMANSSMIPKTLCTTKEGSNEVALPFEQVLSNCFLVVNQATRWGMDPFSVISCCSVVHGRLAYEGKLVAAVLEAKLGISLIYEWDNKTGDAFGIVVTGTLPDGRVESIDGTVGQWKTTGSNSPWMRQPKLQLAYRGAREWARLYAPGVMLGVYSEDEMADLADDARARRAQPITQGGSLMARLAGQAKTEPESGRETASTVRDTSIVDQTTGEVSEAEAADISDSSIDNSDTEAQRTAQDKSPAHASGEQSQASEQEPETSGSGTSQADASRSSQPDLLSGEAPRADGNGEASPQGQTDGADGQEPVTPSAPDRLRSYSKVLAGIENGGPPKLGKQSDLWISKNGAFAGADDKKRSEIYAAHLDRLTGVMDAAACAKKVEEIVAR
jgi:hypothetical protein